MPQPPSTNGQHTNGQHNGSGTAPTVPMKVYRELSAELQATKAMLESMNEQNQHLVRQNQQLRQEIDRVVQSALTLQQIATNSPVVRDVPTDAARNSAEALAAQIRSPRHSATTRDHSATEQPKAASTSTTSFFNDPSLKPTHTEEPASPTKAEEESSREFSGPWLWLAVIAIIVTAFAAGFVLVRPLLPSNR